MTNMRNLLPIVLFAVGCGGSTEMYTTSSWQPGGEKPEPRTRYTSGAVPLLYIENPPSTDGRLVEVTVHREGVEAPVMQEAIDTSWYEDGPTLSAFGKPLKYFGSGSFQVDLVVEGKVVESCSYTVDEPVPMEAPVE